MYLLHTLNKKNFDNFIIYNEFNNGGPGYRHKCVLYNKLLFGKI